MQTPDSQIIASRFFEALRKIIEYKIIRGKQTFTREYGINRWYFNTIEKNLDINAIQSAWLYYLVRDFMVSPRWLLTGEGEIFEYGWDAEKIRDLYKRKKELAKATPKKRTPRKVKESESSISQ